MSDVNLKSPLFEGMMPVPQFAKDVGRDPRTIQRWIAMGLPVSKRGRLQLIDIEQARAWLRGEVKTRAKSRRAA